MPARCPTGSTPWTGSSTTAPRSWPRPPARSAATAASPSPTARPVHDQRPDRPDRPRLRRAARAHRGRARRHRLPAELQLLGAIGDPTGPAVVVSASTAPRLVGDPQDPGRHRRQLRHRPCGGGRRGRPRVCDLRVGHLQHDGRDDPRTAGPPGRPRSTSAPPLGIKNATFPTAIAGSDGRAAVAFLGTPAEAPLNNAGNPENQLLSFDPDGNDPTAGWHAYIAITYDGGANWTTTDITPTDPVQRGCIWWGTAQGSRRRRRAGVREQQAQPARLQRVAVDKYGPVVFGFADGCVAPLRDRGAHPQHQRHLRQPRAAGQRAQPGAVRRALLAGGRRHARPPGVRRACTPSSTRTPTARPRRARRAARRRTGCSRRSSAASASSPLRPRPAPHAGPGGRVSSAAVLGVALEPGPAPRRGSGRPGPRRQRSARRCRARRHLAHVLEQVDHEVVGHRAGRRGRDGLGRGSWSGR